MPEPRPRLHFDFGTLAVAVLSAPVHAYRLLLSPLLPPGCRYTPSCSAYALEALKVHGPVRGLWLAICRIGRCHPVSWLGGGQGLDPVPHSHHTHGRT